MSGLTRQIVMNSIDSTLIVSLLLKHTWLNCVLLERWQFAKPLPVVYVITTEISATHAWDVQSHLSESDSLATCMSGPQPSTRNSETIASRVHMNTTGLAVIPILHLQSHLSE